MHFTSALRNQLTGALGRNGGPLFWLFVFVESKIDRCFCPANWATDDSSIRALMDAAQECQYLSGRKLGCPTQLKVLPQGVFNNNPSNILFEWLLEYLFSSPNAVNVGIPNEFLFIL